ncbi:hypothetical protein ACIP79_11145 [Streptomyces sp. NPDC088747]|uniref:hypothetical protein n=1 Tax=Streptomyces sp. NPDC088747 TaxID=3365886 RepID=UPI003812DFAD
MALTRRTLELGGFGGFVPFSALPATDIPSDGGIYTVLRASGTAPVFLATSTAGWRGQRDPAVSVAALEAKWVDGAEIVYIGKADAGTVGRHGLRGRLAQYARHGLGGTGHHGGRYIWQLTDHAALLVAWRTSAHPRDDERSLIAEFEATHGMLPYANLRH